MLSYRFAKVDNLSVNGMPKRTAGLTLPYSFSG